MTTDPASADPLVTIEAHGIWESSPDGMILVDAHGVVTEANEEAHRLFAFEPGELLGVTVESLMNEDDANRHPKLRAGYAASPHRRVMGSSQRLVARRRDGSPLPVHIALSPIGAGCVIAAVRDISESMAFESRLVEATRRRLLAEDHERIAREMHDTVIQELFALGMTLQATVAQSPDEAVSARIAASVDTLDDVIRSIRALIFDLGDTTEDGQSSLRVDIVDVAASLTPSLGFEPSVSFRGPLDSAIHESQRTHIVAVVREGLTNVARHADATAASVALTLGDAEVKVRVTDDGRGMPSGGSPRSGHANLEARALELGGSWAVEDAVDGGTTLTWVVPLRGQ